MKGAWGQGARGTGHLQEGEEDHRDTGHSLRASPVGGWGMNSNHGEPGFRCRSCLLWMWDLRRPPSLRGHQFSPLENKVAEWDGVHSNFQVWNPDHASWKKGPEMHLGPRKPRLPDFWLALGGRTCCSSFAPQFGQDPHSEPLPG